MYDLKIHPAVFLFQKCIGNLAPQKGLYTLQILKVRRTKDLIHGKREDGIPAIDYGKKQIWK